MAYFNPCCCDKTVRSIFIIGIYDESSIYTGGGGQYSTTFFERCGLWRDFIQQQTWCGNASIRYGFIEPSNPGYDKIWDINGINGTSIDTDRVTDPGWKTVLPVRGYPTPRVFRNEIVDKFTSMLQWPQFPTERFVRDCSGHENDATPYRPRYCTYPEGPEMLIFNIDNSGSIMLSEYEEELIAAKEQLQQTFPKMRILDDFGSSNEDYILDAIQSTQTDLKSYYTARCGKCCKNCVCKNTTPEECERIGGVWTGWPLPSPADTSVFGPIENVNYCKSSNGAADCGC